MTKQPDILDGFEVVESDGVPSITLDNQRRFYVNTTARRLMGVKPYERLAIAYNPAERALAVVTPRGYESLASPELATSNYNVDKRYYMSARHFARHYGYSSEGAPYTFVYERGTADGGVFVFRLADAG